MKRPTPLLLALALSLLPLAFRAPPLHAQVDPDTTVQARVAAVLTGLSSPEGAEGWTLDDRMAHYGVPGVSIAVIRNGELSWARGFGVKQAGTADPVDTETVFSVGSVSKVGAAAATLRLVDDELLDLDVDVNVFLSSWEVPSNGFTAERPPTLRHILSHTGGFTVHGFADYQPGEPLPTVVDILEGRPPAKSPPVRVDFLPGSKWRYSGGGITVEQLVVEDVTGLAFQSAAKAYVFNPLGMSRSTYQNPLPAAHGNIARAHGPDGTPRALPRGWEAMPEAAASGLWTTPSDYARLIIAFMESWRGEPGAFLSRELARDMMTEVPPGDYGLGPQLAGEGPTRRFMHGGSNDSYKAFMVGFLETGAGAVVFTNGARGGELYPEIVVAIARAEGWPVEVMR